MSGGLGARAPGAGPEAGGRAAAESSSSGADEAREEGPGAAAPGPWRERLRERLRGLTRRQILWGLFAVLCGAGLILGWRHLDIEAFHEWAESQSALLVTALVGVLPLGGFPVSALHLVAGVRFPFWPALFVVLITTVFQHAAAWALVRLLPARTFGRLDKWRGKLADAGHREAAVLCSLVPGMPYTVQLYLLPVIGSPLSVLCLISAPLHTARATVTILLGNISDDLSAARIAGLVAYYLAIVLGCGFALRRLRRRLRAEETRGAGGGG